MPSALPGLQLADRERDHAERQRQDQAVAFGDADERLGGDHASLRVLPADQSLDAVELAAREVEPGQVFEEQLALLDRLAQFVEQHELFRGRQRIRFGTGANGPLRAPRRQHQDLGALLQIMRRAAIERIGGETDVRFEADLEPVDDERPAELAHDPCGLVAGRLGVARSREQQAELGLADPGERVGAAQALAQPGHRLGQQLLGERLAHRRANGSQQLEMDAQERHRLAGAIRGQQRLVDAIGEQHVQRQPRAAVEQRARLARRVQPGDVLQHGDPDAVLAELHRAERSAELEALAVLAPGEQLRAGAFAADRQPQFVALGAGQQAAKRHARELLAGVAEHGLCGPIAGAGVDAVAIKGQDRGAAARGERRHQEVALPPRRVGVLAGLAVGGRALEPPEAPGGQAREKQGVRAAAAGRARRSRRTRTRR